MKAMILAAGRGTRLGDLSLTIPKVLVDINGKSILHRMVEKCTGSGFDDIMINVHHLSGMVIEEINMLRGLGFRISVSDESEELLDTGGGLFRARRFFGTEPFLLCNGDILTDLDLNQLYSYHIQKNGLATLAVRNRPGNRVFLVDPEGKLCGWANKATCEKIISKKTEEDLTEISFSSFHVIEPEIFYYMKDGIYSMTSLYLELAASQRIYTLTVNSGYWFDIGTPEKLQEARVFFSGQGIH
jgi:N-acetyl-alpha-D-muramate 1-phosphate uridylyltransferase